MVRQAEKCSDKAQRFADKNKAYKMASKYLTKCRDGDETPGGTRIGELADNIARVRADNCLRRIYRKSCAAFMEEKFDADYWFTDHINDNYIMDSKIVP